MLYIELLRPLCNLQTDVRSVRTVSGFALLLGLLGCGSLAASAVNTAFVAVLVAVVALRTYWTERHCWTYSIF